MCFLQDLQDADTRTKAILKEVCYSLQLQQSINQGDYITGRKLICQFYDYKDATLYHSNLGLWIWSCTGDWNTFCSRVNNRAGINAFPSRIGNFSKIETLFAARSISEPGKFSVYSNLELDWNTFSELGEFSVHKCFLTWNWTGDEPLLSSEDWLGSSMLIRLLWCFSE